MSEMAQADRAPGPIHQLLSELQGSISRLDNTLDQLYSNISPILSQSTPSLTGDIAEKQAAGGDSVIYAELREAINRIDNLSDRARSHSQRVEA